MKLRVIATALVALSLCSASAFAGIGLYSDMNGASCNGTLPLFVQTPYYVLYVGGTNLATGAEYRIDGQPGLLNADYLATLINAPNSNLNLGSGFDGTGHVVAFPSAQPFDGNGNLLLATYNLLALSPNATPAANLQIVMRNPPTNVMFPCPLIVKTDFTLECQAGGNMRVNDPNTPCTVAVDETTWTGVRELYR